MNINKNIQNKTIPILLNNDKITFLGEERYYKKGLHATSYKVKIFYFISV